MEKIDCNHVFEFANSDAVADWFFVNLNWQLLYIAVLMEGWRNGIAEDC